MPIRRQHLLAAIVAMAVVAEREARAQHFIPTAFAPSARVSLDTSLGRPDSLSRLESVALVLPHTPPPPCRQSRKVRVIGMTITFGLVGWGTYGFTRRLFGAPLDAGMRNGFILVGAGTGAILALVGYDC